MSEKIVCIIFMDGLSKMIWQILIVSGKYIVKSGCLLEFLWASIVSYGNNIDEKWKKWNEISLLRLFFIAN